MCKLERLYRKFVNSPLTPGCLSGARVLFFLWYFHRSLLCAVEFVDKDLETQVRALVPGNSGGELSVYEVSSITRLEAYSASISSLVGMEYMTGLTYANLSANKSIQDLTPLTGLTQLEELRLADNAIVDLSPLANLLNLRILRLYDNLITDFSPLKNLVNLEELWLWGNQVSDISTSKYFPDLTTYYLYGNQQWKQLDWFGFFYDGEAPDYDTYGPHWIYHAVHGWLYWQLPDDPYSFTSFWVWSSDLGWSWFSESTYPFVWSTSRGGWLWYQEGTLSPRLFYNFGTKSWEQL